MAGKQAKNKVRLLGQSMGRGHSDPWGPTGILGQTGGAGRAGRGESRGGGGDGPCDHAYFDLKPISQRYLVSDSISKMLLFLFLFCGTEV
jgi:hypothetical protein